MPIARDLKVTWDYILDEDKKSASPTTFKLKALPQHVEDSIWERIYQMDHNASAAIAGQPEILLASGLDGWEDFLDTDGEPVKFDRKKLRASLEYLTPQQRQELAWAIWDRNKISETDQD